MVFGQVNFREAGENAEPSPSIWADCPGPDLVKNGKGYFFHEDFLGAPLVNTTITAALLSRLSVAPSLGIDGDDDTVLTRKAAEQGGYLDIETDGDDNDAAALFSQPFAEIVLNSGNKVWAEIRMELGAATDQGVFFGLVEEAGMSRDVVADNAGALIGESLVGFQILTGDQDAVDFVFKKDAGTAVVPLADINLATTGGNTAANLAANTEFKLGLVFDGKDKISVFYNGYKVYDYTLDSSTFPVGVKMGVIVGIKTGTTATPSIAIDWIRAAARVRT